MKNQDYLFIWKAKLLERIFRFAVVFGFLTLIVSGIITIMNGMLLQAGMYVVVYLIALFVAFKKGLTFDTKVYGLITLTFLIAAIVMLMEGDLTIGFIWIVYGIFFSVTFLDRKRVYKIILIAVVLVLIYMFNDYYKLFNAGTGIRSTAYMIKYINSMIFLIAGILYVNDELINSVTLSFSAERDARLDLRDEKVKLEKSNVLLERKVSEIDALKSELVIANEQLEKKVEIQEKGIQDTLEDLRNEIENHKTTEEELIRTREELIMSLDKEKALNEMKTKFIAMISHEYRTPLTILMNSTYLLDKYFELNEKEKFDNSLRKINHSVISMTDLLEEVIRFGHSDIDEQDNEFKELDIVNQLETLITNFKNQEKKQFEVKLATTSDSIIVKTDARKVRIILNNIIKNAIQYSPENSTVFINVRTNSGKVFVSIQDSGIGITENDFDMIFEPFYRGENTIGNSGTGLGLAISKRYADAIGGEIKFDSQTGKGSNFILIIPINKV